MLARHIEIKIINLDKLTYAGSLENLTDVNGTDRYSFVQGDICDTGLVEQVLRDFEIDTIVHFAAETHVDRSIRNPAPFIETNIHGTFTLLEAARTCWHGDGVNYRFHHISTDEVYGSLELGEAAWKEEAAYHPTSPYAASKAAADFLVRSFCQTYGLPITISNCTNNYGPRQYPEKLIPLTIALAIEKKSIPVYGDGRQERDWLHVDDHCAGIEAILMNGVVGESYHLAANQSIPNTELVKQICEILDAIRPKKEGKSYTDQITLISDRAGHDRKYALDSTKARLQLNWSAMVPLQEGLNKVVHWYLAHQEWLAAIKVRSEYRQWMADQYHQEGFETEE